MGEGRRRATLLPCPTSPLTGRRHCACTWILSGVLVGLALPLPSSCSGETQGRGRGWNRRAHGWLSTAPQPCTAQPPQMSTARPPATARTSAPTPGTDPRHRPQEPTPAGFWGPGAAAGAQGSARGSHRPEGRQEGWRAARCSGGRAGRRLGRWCQRMATPGTPGHCQCPAHLPAGHRPRRAPAVTRLHPHPPRTPRPRTCRPTPQTCPHPLGSVSRTRPSPKDNTPTAPLPPHPPNPPPRTCSLP